MGMNEISSMAEKNSPTTIVDSSQPYDARNLGTRQLDDGLPRKSEEDIQREKFGPRGVPGKTDPARMVPQREKKTPRKVDPGHTA
jgi:hypothetical protein